MAFSEILKAYATRKLDQPLRDVTVKHGDTVLLTGHGWLRIEEDGSLVIEFITNEGLRVYDKDSEAGAVTFPTDNPVLEALLEDGSKLRAYVYRLSPQSWTPVGGRIKFSPWEVEIHIHHPVKLGTGIIGLLTPFQTDLANTFSILKDDNPFFGREEHYSWLKLDLDGTTVGLRKEESGLRWLSFTEQKTKSPDVVKHAEAFLTALSFLVGQSVLWLAFTTVDGDSEIVRLRQPDKKQRGLVEQPLPLDLSAYRFGKSESDVLVQGTTFFHANDRVGHWLMLCWNAAGGYFPTQCLVASSVVEALAKFITKDSPQAATLKPEKEKFDGFKKECVTVLENNEGTKNSEFLKRIVNRINPTDYLRYEESIKKAGEIVRPGDPIVISDEEISAWNKLRNSTAHGVFQTGQVPDAAVLKQMHRYDCCVNIINKLVLGLIGYTGPFRDYSKPNYPTETL